MGAPRQQRQLPLDDCLYALQPAIPHLTRSSLHRCLQRQLPCFYATCGLISIIRLDEDVIAKFRAGGKGWQSRMNEALRKAAGI